jgi:hypothetical protein
MPFVVWASDFDEKSGGNIVLHRLAYMLKEQGHEVYLSNKTATDMPRGWLRGGLARLSFLAGYASRRKQHWQGHRPKPRLASLFRQRVVTHPAMPVPTLPGLSGRPFVAIYPQRVSGNPLEAPHVVRWLLHRPDFKTEGVRYTEGELTFFYQTGFVTDWSGIDPENLLQVRWLRDDIYRDRGLPDRQGFCRMVRKGSSTFSPEITAGDRFGILDDLPHAEIAAIFNQCKIFYCHDPYTMYLYYAALCGCIPVVVPQPGLDAQTWRSGFELKQGVAYGEEETSFARETREGLLADMASASKAEEGAVDRFVGKVQERFGS